MGGWLEQSGIKLISTQVVVEVEVGDELGKKIGIRNSNNEKNCIKK